MRQSFRINQAVAFVIQGMNAGKWRLNGQLPSLKSLADLAGVSRGTMWKALRHLKKKGMITTTARGKIFQSTHVSAHAPASAKAPAQIWQRKRIVIEREIHGGVLSVSGSLFPTSSFLQARYGVSFRTLRKILQALEKDGVIIPFKRSYMVPQIEQRQHGSTIRLVSGARGNLFSQKFSRQIITSLERECAQHAITLEMAYVDWQDKSLDQTFRAAADITAPLVAFILPVDWFESHHPEKLNALLRQMAGTKLPVAIIDMTAEYIPPHEFQIPTLKTFRIAGTSAGFTIGQFLLSMGHERTAYISSQHYYSWSKQRLAGMAQRYGNTGLSDNLYVAVSQDIGGFYERTIAMSGLEKEKFLFMITGYPQKKMFEAAFESDEPVFEDEVFENTPENIRRDIKADFQALFETSSGKFTAKSFIDMQESVILSANRRVNLANLQALFKRTLASTDASAWVCASDDMALSALEYLKTRNIGVPRKISVCGFDNIPEALDAGLTSYDFNFSMIVSRIMRFLLESNRRLIQKASYECIVDVPGLVIQRKSARKMKNRQA
jgi:DNA-binding LacI/PurR family transcriptional regulator/DNA-binding transcriptional regulator YhcF (GntR family)